MFRYITTRIIWIFITLMIILTMNFVILQLAPTYAPTTTEERDLYYAKLVFDGYYTEEVVRDEELIRLYRDITFVPCNNCFYKDEVTQFRVYKPVPLFEQYTSWLYNIITDWNWGDSTRVQPNVPAFEILASRIPVTLRLNFLAMIFYIPIGFTLGIIAALNKNSWVDNAISIFIMLFISIPSFVIMILLVIIFGYQLEWVPTLFPPDFADLSQQIRGLILPVLGLSFSAIAGLTRLTRAELTEVLTSEFLLLARTKGLTKRQAVVRHALRNSIVPIVPSVIGSFVGLLSGSVIIERIYSIPGTGRIFLRALEQNNYDYNLIMVSTAFYTFIGLIAVLVVDLTYGLVDPRIRMGAKK